MKVSELARALDALDQDKDVKVRLSDADLADAPLWDVSDVLEDDWPVSGPSSVFDDGSHVVVVADLAEY